MTDIASPLFKVNWPGAPVSQYGTKEDMHGADEAGFKHQDEVLERAISLAKQFKTNKVRCFDFWRIDDCKPYRAAINDKLRQAAEYAVAQNIMLVLENEYACNTATGREAAATLAGVASRNLSLNWDPGNAVMRGELDAYPGGWDALPKERIHHCHVKNAIKDSTGKTQWSPVDKGYIDWTAQFRAFAKNWLLRCGQSRNALEGRRHARRIHPYQLGRHEERSRARQHGLSTGELLIAMTFADMKGTGTGPEHRAAGCDCRGNSPTSFLLLRNFPQRSLPTI